MDRSGTNALSSRVQFSPVTGEDFDALVEIRIAAMRESLERVGRFDPGRARERLRKSFCPEETRFILLDGGRVGFYTFRPVDDGMMLDHLYVHPTCQSQGVGSYVMGRLIAEATAAGCRFGLGRCGGVRRTGFTSGTGL